VPPFAGLRANPLEISNVDHGALFAPHPELKSGVISYGNETARLGISLVVDLTAAMNKRNE
jgi:hypothetical protein